MLVNSVNGAVDLFRCRSAQVHIGRLHMHDRSVGYGLSFKCGESCLCLVGPVDRSYVVYSMI